MYNQVSALIDSLRKLENLSAEVQKSYELQLKMHDIQQVQVADSAKGTPAIHLLIISCA